VPKLRQYHVWLDYRQYLIYRTTAVAMASESSDSQTQSLIHHLSQGTARQSDSTCCSIWTTLSTISTLHAVDVQWIHAHVGLEDNAAADQEAKCRSTVTQSTVTIDYTTACATLSSHQHHIAHGRYHSDPHSRVHRVFTDSEHIHQR